MDLIIRKDRAFSREEFSRRQAADLAGTTVSLASPEDTVLSKLEWAKKGGGSDRQVADVAGIIAVKAEGLDREYIERWAAILDVLDLWRRASSES